MHIPNPPESIDDLNLDWTSYQFPPYPKNNFSSKPRIIYINPTPTSPRMQDQVPQLPRRDLLIPKSAAHASGSFDTSDEDGAFTPAETTSTAPTSMTTVFKKPVQQISRPATPKAPSVGSLSSRAPTTPISDRERMLEKERKRKREQTPLDDAQIQIQVENRQLEKRTKSPSPGTIRPIIKKSPKRTNVRFADLRGSPIPMGLTSNGGHKRKASGDALTYLAGGGGEKQEESEDTLGEEKLNSNTSSPKAKRRKTPRSLFSTGPTSTLMYAGAAAVFFGFAGVKLFSSTAIEQSNLTALCHLPGVQGLADALPFCHTTQPRSKFMYNKGDQTPPDYKRLMELQFSFEKILEDSVGGSRLALDMKTSEMAVRDLTTLVKVSGLACREQLVVHLDQFGDSARVASRALSKFSSRVMGTIDSILALDEWAKRRLEIVRDEEVASRNSITSVLLYKWQHSEGEMRQSISNVFLKTTEEMNGQLERLVIEAEKVLRLLDELEERLTTIHEIVAREINHVKMENDEVLSAILTKLGANRQRIARNKEHVKLLNNVGHYRKTALGHVSATVVELERMSADLEQLRETVAAPRLLEGVVEVPIELHIRNIDQGIMRLTAGRLKASNRKDEYHQAVIAGIDYRNMLVDDQIEEIASKPLIYNVEV